MNKRKSIAEIEAEELEEEVDGILRDGQSVRVSLFMRDGAINPDLTATQRGKAMAAQQPLVSDGSSNPMAMHRPGFRYLTDANRRAISDAAKAKAYQEAETADANAWKGAARSHDAGEFSKPPPRRQDPAIDARAEAYRLYDEEQQNAWRGPNR